MLVSCLKEKFVANLIQICKAREAGPSLFPIIKSYSNPTPIREDDVVAILHVSGTWSFHAIRLLPGMTMHDLKRKIWRDLGAELNSPSEQVLESFLKRQRVQDVL